MERTDRSRRRAEQIKRSLAQLIVREVSDPRLGMVGISAVELSKDYQAATVYITVPKEDEIEDSMAALRSAAGFLRHELGRSLNQRSTPSLEFIHDASIQHGFDLSNLIDSINR